MSQDLGISHDRELLARLTDRAMHAEVASQARCADGGLDPDAWFPVSTDAEAARREAAWAIAVCAACPVRRACLELSLRQWAIGQHGVWGGLVAPERVALRRQWLASAGDRRLLSVLDGGLDGPTAKHAAGRSLQPDPSYTRVPATGNSRGRPRRWRRPGG